MLTDVEEFDAIIIGGGTAGLYQLHRLRQLGMHVRLFEAGGGVGGVWYWNCYPGARLDSESYSYGYSFSKELLEEWDWSERFVAQPELSRYFNHFADRFGLRDDIQLNSTVAAAQYDDGRRAWDVTLEDGRRYRGRFLITALGPLSASVKPRIKGVDSFKGLSCHTSRWPREPVSFEGKRVAVIGTGSTGVQVIQESAKTAAELVVFQRTPNWAVPLNNSRIDDEQTQKEIKASYDEVFARCNASAACFIHTTDPRSVFEVGEEEREAFFEERYRSPGFGLWQGNFRDMMTDPEANAVVSAFVEKKIRQRVRDPKIADKLVPKNHGFGTRRVPLETRYYEVYNQPNVTLVDVNETPILEITETGIRTSVRDFAFDIIVYATGFDAVTGSFDAIDIRNHKGVKLKEKWSGGLSSLVGMLVDEFPNLLTVLGPYTALGNVPRSIEYNVDWITDFVRLLRDRGMTRVEARPEAVEEWVDYVKSIADGLMSMKVDSWMTGINTNIEGRTQRSVILYRGTAPNYRAWADTIAQKGYYDHIRLE
ncbi:MAG: flavin-containing monooxygenase [Rhizobiaceae bacterium]